MNNNHEKKYKYTRQLLKIAQDHGDYKQKQIAEKAGLSPTSISLVSKWVTGKALATERQMRYFIKHYEHFLKRKMEHLFYSVMIENGMEKVRFTKLSGEIIFNYRIKIPRHQSPFYLNREQSVLRIVILQEGNQFHLVHLFRAGFINVERDHNGTLIPHSLNHDDLVHSDHENSNWYVLNYREGIELDEMVQRIRKYCERLISRENIVDAAFTTSNPSDYPNSIFFNRSNVYPLELAFYQKMLSLGLNSEHYPFNVKEQNQ